MNEGAHKINLIPVCVLMTKFFSFPIALKVRVAVCLRAWVCVWVGEKERERSRDSCLRNIWAELSIKINSWLIEQKSYTNQITISNKIEWITLFSTDWNISNSSPEKQNDTDSEMSVGRVRNVHMRSFFTNIRSPMIQITSNQLCLSFNVYWSGH